MRSTTTEASHLLDANALIALVIADHEHHARATTWAVGVTRFATCPIVEGALVRYLLRIGESAQTAARILAAIHASGRAAFWPDEVSFVDVSLDHVIGHRQVTDAYLAALAVHRSAALATFDAALARALPAAVELIP